MGKITKYASTAEWVLDRATDFESIADAYFKKRGRGAVFADVDAASECNKDAVIKYFSEKSFEQIVKTEMVGAQRVSQVLSIIKAYNPATEYVVLLKVNSSMSTHRIPKPSLVKTSKMQTVAVIVGVE